MTSGGWLRSRPRVCGTTQKVQYSSHPSITVTNALSRPAAGGRAVILTSGPSPVSSTGRRSRRTRSTSSPTRAMAGEPKTRSTAGARRWIACWWSWAMQPMTPMTRSGRCALSNRSSPSFEKTFSSAFSRIAQVLTRIRSASASSSVSSQLRSRSKPATRPESYRRSAEYSRWGEIGGSGAAPPDLLIDLFGSAAAPRAGRLLAAVVPVAVAVAEGQWRLQHELPLEAVAPLLPPFLVLELVLVQGGGLLDTVRVAELDRQLRGGAAHLVPRRAQRELIGDGADPTGVDIARKRDGREDRARPVRGL